MLSSSIAYNSKKLSNMPRYMAMRTWNDLRGAHFGRSSSYVRAHWPRKSFCGEYHRTRRISGLRKATESFHRYHCQLEAGALHSRSTGGWQIKSARPGSAMVDTLWVPISLGLGGKVDNVYRPCWSGNHLRGLPAFGLETWWRLWIIIEANGWCCAISRTSYVARVRGDCLIRLYSARTMTWTVRCKVAWFGTMEDRAVDGSVLDNQVQLGMGFGTP